MRIVVEESAGTSGRSNSTNMGQFISVNNSPEEIDMTTPQAQYINEKITNNKVVIFSKSYCPYCVMAKEQFQKINVPFIAIELDKTDDGDQIQSLLGQLTGARTVPRVFVDGKCIGGGTDVKSMYQNGTLQKLFY